MGNETAPGSAGRVDGGGHSQGGDAVGSPLQARAQFLKNWSWESVTSINRGTCQRGGAQHGFNSETGSSCAKTWKPDDTSCKLMALPESLILEKRKKR